MRMRGERQRGRLPRRAARARAAFAFGEARRSVSRSSSGDAARARSPDLRVDLRDGVVRESSSAEVSPFVLRFVLRRAVAP